MKLEMEAMKKKIEDLETVKTAPKVFSLGFDEKDYLDKGFIESAKWISATVAMNMKEKLKTHDIAWNELTKIKTKEIGIPCATYNRGELCNQGNWHTSTRKKHVSLRISEPFRNPPKIDQKASQSSREELRIHCCTLCVKALGIMSNHPVLECPWILESNWIKKGTSTSTSATESRTTFPSSSK
jgi:hypothetical protein